LTSENDPASYFQFRQFSMNRTMSSFCKTFIRSQSAFTLARNRGALLHRSQEI
jgi:hypothetical protein